LLGAAPSDAVRRAQYRDAPFESDERSE